MRAICCALLAMWCNKTASDFVNANQSKVARGLYHLSYGFVVLASVFCIVGV